MEKDIKVAPFSLRISYPSRVQIILSISATVEKSEPRQRGPGSTSRASGQSTSIWTAYLTKTYRGYRTKKAMMNRSPIPNIMPNARPRSSQLSFEGGDFGFGTCFIGSSALDNPRYASLAQDASTKINKVDIRCRGPYLRLHGEDQRNRRPTLSRRARSLR
jgi:hypothetical protein